MPNTINDSVFAAEFGRIQDYEAQYQDGLISRREKAHRIMDVLDEMRARMVDEFARGNSA